MNPLRMLVVEDEEISQRIILSFLKAFGSCDSARTGKSAVDMIRRALDAGQHYDLITLDIKLPEMNGDEVLQELRRIETEAGLPSGNGAKVIMTTVIDDPRAIMGAFKNLCEAYIIKPVEKNKLIEQMRKLGLIT